MGSEDACISEYTLLQKNLLKLGSIRLYVNLVTFRSENKPLQYPNFLVIIIPLSQLPTPQPSAKIDTEYM